MVFFTNLHRFDIWRSETKRKKIPRIFGLWMLRRPFRKSQYSYTHLHYLRQQSNPSIQLHFLSPHRQPRPLHLCNSAGTVPYSTVPLSLSLSSIHHPTTNSISSILPSFHSSFHTRINTEKRKQEVGAERRESIKRLGKGGKNPNSKI